ncbi:MAG: 4-(cytidine 5'-diphospho)-2-C-methyl-D-erythritol kinase, partial [Actinobacteria bacterium]
MTDTIVVAAPAKVNLYLAVGAAGTDGYHDVTTVLAALEFGDEVTIAQADALSLVCTPDVGVAAEDNLAYRAAVAFAATCGREPSVALRVTKRVPAGAGLGGGSSDAAAVLRGLASLWGVDGDDTRLRETAVTLGADVPFFLDAPCALMGGRGDVLLRGIDAPQLDLVVVWPGEPVPTAAAYRAFDAAPAPVQPSPDALLAALESGDRTGVAAHLHNAMTSASAGLVPVIADA